MATATDRSARGSAEPLHVRPIVRLWREPHRVEQLTRLKSAQIQSADAAARNAWEQAAQLQAQLPAGIRIDLPSPRVFARVLGVYRSAASFLKRPMLALELSAADIAAVAGYSKSVVEAALRWLGSEPIIYRGQQVARGLGYIDRARRKAKAFLKGALRDVYRTSISSLTMLGRGLVGLLPVLQDEQPRRKCAWRRHVDKSAAGPRPPEPPRQWDAGLAAVEHQNAIVRGTAGSHCQTLGGGIHTVDHSSNLALPLLARQPDERRPEPWQSLGKAALRWPTRLRMGALGSNSPP